MKSNGMVCVILLCLREGMLAPGAGGQAFLLQAGEMHAMLRHALVARLR